MHLVPPLPDDAELIFRFVGGPKDGEEVRSDEPVSPWTHTAEFLWKTTRGALIEASNWTPSEYSLRAECEMASAVSRITILPRHLYVLAEKIESSNQIISIMTHRGVERGFD